MGFLQTFQKGLDWVENVVDEAGDIVDVFTGDSGGEVRLSVDPDNRVAVDARENPNFLGTNFDGENILRSSVQVGSLSIPIVLVGVGAYLLLKR